MEFNPQSSGKTLFTTDEDSVGVFRSDDGGQSWGHLTTGFDLLEPSRIERIRCLDADTNVLIAASTSKGLFRSSDGGQHWNNVLPDVAGEALSYEKRYNVLYFTGNFRGELWRSSDLGASWQATNHNDSVLPVCSIMSSPEDAALVLEGAGNGSIGRSTNGGLTWSVVEPSENDSITSLTPETPLILFSQHKANVVYATRWLSRKRDVLRSVDAGVTWESLPAAQFRVWALEIDQRSNKISTVPQHLWTGLFNVFADTVKSGVVQESTDGGTTWFNTDHPNVHQVWMLKFDTASQTLASATDSGLFIARVNAAIRQTSYETGLHISVNLEHAHLSWEENAKELQVFDVMGRLQTSLDVRNAKSATFSGIPGLYIAILRDGRRSFTRRFLLGTGFTR